MPRTNATAKASGSVIRVAVSDLRHSGVVTTQSLWPEGVGDGPAVAGQRRRAVVDLGEEQGESAGDAILAGLVQRDGDLLGRVGDAAAEPADDRLPGDGPVLVIVLQVGVEVPGEVMLGVGGQQAQDQLQAAPSDV